ncbi:hypothetical protein L6452_31240 [Arctium lappa]|uniref:Uncharacterized protein n=1 Tax=Arctium lappa TaxID=4217 RepID=A0ACB8ZKH1_ARCLA|nr:hypothetical protein L6452_31240 [Arctium lappa]
MGRSSSSSSSDSDSAFKGTGLRLIGVEESEIESLQLSGLSSSESVESLLGLGEGLEDWEEHFTLSAFELLLKTKGLSSSSDE